MEMNRLERLLQEMESGPALSYYKISTPWDTYLVSAEEAERVVTAVNMGFGKDLTRVKTVAGAVVYLRIDLVVSVQEFTPESRAYMRDFRKELQRESESEDES